MSEECSNVCLASNFKTLTKSISSAQSSIFRCKSTLKCIEEELIYLNLSCNTNTNNRDSKRIQQVQNSPNPEVVPYNIVDMEANQSKLVDNCSHNYRGDFVIKPNKTRRSFTNITTTDPVNNCGLSPDTNVCNISSELTNLLRAQQKLLCQIEKLKCDIGEKSCAIDQCLKENQFFNCKFKEVEGHIEQIRRDVEKIKKDLAMSVSKDRGFSPYSYESVECAAMPQPMPVQRQCGSRMGAQEQHFGYQEVYTPDHSQGMTHPPRRSAPNLKMIFRDANCQSKTFEDLIRKSKMDIDCNINNCRNNQNTSNLNLRSNNNVLMDFVSLNNQIKSLRKMAETIFKNNCNGSTRRPALPDENLPTVSKNTDIAHDDQSKSSNNKPMAETTLSLINEIRSSEPKQEIKEDLSSIHSSPSDSDTSCCFCTEDQLPTNSPLKPHYNNITKQRKLQHFSTDRNTKKMSFNIKQNPDRNNHKNKERNCGKFDCTASNNCSTYKCQSSNYHNHSKQARQVCPECKNLIGANRHQVNH